MGTVKSGNRRAMACAPHRDHRFEVLPGHSQMRAAGFQSRPQEAVVVTPRLPAKAYALPATRSQTSADQRCLPVRLKVPKGISRRFLPGCGLRVATGLDWRRRRTQELDASRGAGGLLYANAADMRPAGVSTKHQSEVCLRGWHAYKQTVRNMAPTSNSSDALTASCPDMRALLTA
ncbi:unnamed protein product [Effrenium voratum]|nr:unnamed protein product [Effrenium voratum]